jgi:hypothetical protein
MFCYTLGMQEHLCHSHNHVDITFDPDASHTATHFEDTPELKAAVTEVLSRTDVEGPKMFFEHDVGRIIGTTDLVVTTDSDEIVYAKRKNRSIYTRFTKSQFPRDCSTVVIHLEQRTDNEYELSSAWIGSIGPSFPGDDNETPDSKPYWSTHALVWGRQEIQEGTETPVCPW